MSLKALVRSRGFVLRAVALRIGMKPDKFYANCRGYGQLPFDKVEPLAVAIGVTIEDVLAAGAKPKQETQNGPQTEDRGRLGE